MKRCYPNRYIVSLVLMRSCEIPVTIVFAAKYRTPVIQTNEPNTRDITLRDYQDELVRRGLEEVEEGLVIAHEDVLKRFR